MSGMLSVKWHAMSAPGGEKRRRVVDLETKGAHLFLLLVCIGDW